MIDSECSVVVGDQRALARGADEPVVPNPGREGEEALSDSDGDADMGTAAVLFEAELTLEGVVDGLDALADPALPSPAVRLIAPVRPYECGAECADEVFEVPAGIPLVGHDEQARTSRRPLQHGLDNLPVPNLGVGQAPDHHRAVGGGEQVQTQTPEVARVGGAIAVVGPAGEFGALDRLARGATGHWC